VTGPSTPQVSWKAIERDAAVVSVDGAKLATVVEVAGDRNADIFNGLVVVLPPLVKKRYLPAERVTAIWPRRVEVDLTRAEIGALAAYDEPVVGHLPQEGSLTRLRRRLFGGPS
jgi:hypothetical protein